MIVSGPLSGIRTGGQRVREAARDLAMLARLTRDLPGFLRRPVTTDAARQRLRQQLQSREARFLLTVERGVYRQEHSPYLALLRHAGCELGAPSCRAEAGVPPVRLRSRQLR